MSPLQLLIIAGLVFVNGFFVAAEFALVKVRSGQIDQLAEQGNWAAKLTSRALDRLDSYLSASQLGITVASLALGFAIEKLVKPLETADGRAPDRRRNVGATATLSLASVLAFSMVTFLHMALGEQAPKSLAIRSARTIALWTAPGPGGVLLRLLPGDLAVERRQQRHALDARPGQDRPRRGGPYRGRVAPHRRRERRGRAPVAQRARACSKTP